MFADVARHEAGHLIACAMLRVPVTRVVISSADRGITSHGRIVGTRRGTNRRLVKKRAAIFARINVAGPLAERIPCGDSDRQVLDAMRRAEVDVSHTFWRDAKPFRKSIDTYNLSDKRAAQDARRLLRRNWRAVLMLARVLEVRCDDEVRLHGVPSPNSTTPIISLDEAEAAALVRSALGTSRRPAAASPH